MTQIMVHTQKKSISTRAHGTKFWGYVKAWTSQNSVNGTIVGDRVVKSAV